MSAICRADGWLLLSLHPNGSCCLQRIAAWLYTGPETDGERYPRAMVASAGFLATHDNDPALVVHENDDNPVDHTPWGQVLREWPQGDARFQRVARTVLGIVVPEHRGRRRRRVEDWGRVTSRRLFGDDDDQGGGP